MTRVLNGLDEVYAAVGEEIGVSPWHHLDQGLIDRFAAVTGDEYFIHVDPERARSEAGLDSTIAHGLFTLSLGPMFSYSIMEVRGVGSALNYGYDKVRFTRPVPVDSKVRMRLRLTAVDETAEGVRLGCRQTFEVEGSEKPVCVADSVFFYWKG
ncbi:MAG: MaoC family dehydratase [Actinobacteria bacterium]|nr:MaoC family dehydratase [Actinomycetota bacterium]